MILLVLFLLVALPICGAFFSGLWFFRNYRDTARAVSARIGAILLFITAVVVGIIPLLAIGIFIENSQWVQNNLFGNSALLAILSQFEYAAMAPWGWIFGEQEFVRFYGDPLKFPGALVSKWLATFVVVAMGGLVGLTQRGARTAFWKTEDHNNKFLSDSGLTEREDGNLEDSYGNMYRIESQTKSKIELFAVGRRNKRGYIGLDGDGRMLSWTGLVTKGKI